jgi:hypothetical protein
MKIHEIMADNRVRFAQRLNEMSEELATLAKEVDKNRKQVRGTLINDMIIDRPYQTKELATRYERALQDSENTVEKCKSRFDTTAEELERLLIQKEGESYKDTGVRSPGGVGGKRALGKAVAKGGLLLKGRNPGNVSRKSHSTLAPHSYGSAPTARR